MNKKPQLCDLYFGRNLISIIIILALLDKEKNQNKKILYISKSKSKNYSNHLNKTFLKIIHNFLNQYFDEIHYVNYSRLIKKKGRLGTVLERSKSIKSNEKNIKLELGKNFKVSNIYAGGDDFENLLLNKINNFPKFHLVEHGYGPLRDFIFYKVKLKDRLFCYFIKILYNLKLISYYPIEYSSYVGTLTKKINYDKFVNCKLISKNKNITLNSILNKIFVYLKNKKKMKKRKYRYILFNYSSIIISKDKSKFNKLLKNISLLIDKDKECVLIKGHPNYTSNKTEKFIKALTFFFKKNKIKYMMINNDHFLKILPSQVLIKLLKIKKIISDLSTVPFHMSDDTSLKCYIPLDYAIENVSRIMYKSRDLNFKKFFFKIGKNITFLK